MTKTLKMRLVRGKHQKLVDGERVDCEVGEVIELTPEQADAFKDKFEPANAAQQRMEAQTKAEADAQKEADKAAKAEAIKAAEEAVAKAKEELAAAGSDEAKKKSAQTKVTEAEKLLAEAKK